MLAASKREPENTQAKKPSGRAGTEPASADSAGINSLWQSLAMRSGALQHKLTIGQADDPYEREADRVADQVMRMPAPQSEGHGLSITPVTLRQAQRKCAECQEEEEEGALQRKESSGAEAPATAPPTVDQTLSSPGQPLDPATRAYFEPRFGYDFSRVRAHINGQAAQSAADVKARAYTVGQHVVFGAGKYAPGTNAGDSLIAHELAHTVQQGADVVRPQADTFTTRVQRAPAESAASAEYKTETGMALSTHGATFDQSCNGAQQKIVELVLKKAKLMVDRAVVRML